MVFDDVKVVFFVVGVVKVRNFEWIMKIMKKVVLEV